MSKPEAEESNESPEEETTEMREGSEEAMPKGRRPKAKPMKDTECTCGASKKKKDYEMGPGMKMDALTPQEYLDACDLGIQHESRAYIRARLDAEERLDLKCGNGSISQGEKCTKGGAQQGQQKQYKQGNVDPNQKAAKRLRTAGKVVGTLGALAPLAGLASGKAAGMVAGFGAARSAFGAAGALNTYAKAQETGSRAGRARLQKEAKGQALKAGGSLLTGAASGLALAHLSNKQNRRASMERAYRGPSAKRDSIYADGFSFDPASLAI